MTSTVYQRMRHECIINPPFQCLQDRVFLFRLDLPIRAVANSLHFLILLLQLPLHLEISLPLPFDLLLFHIANDALVHSLIHGQLNAHRCFTMNHLQPGQISAGGERRLLYLSHLQ